MMKKFKNLYTLAALLITGAAITACTSNDDLIQSQPEVQKTYKMTVTVTKDADTRTLTEEDGALSAAWNADDEVKVFKGEDEVGTLKPTKAGSSKLTGEVTDVEVNDELTLTFGSPDYAEQDGTLAGIDATCNYAIATVKVTEIVGDAVNTEAATFENQQAITKFTFNKEVKSVVITGGAEEISVTPASATKTLYVAMPGAAKRTYAFTAVTSEGNIFMDMKSVALNNGFFYTATITLSGNQLIQHWPFDGNANNAVTTDNATVSGATLTTDRFGNEEGAYNFDGNDVISISKGAVSFGVTSFTANVWFCSSQTSGYGNILRADNGWNGQGWLLRLNSGRLEIWEGRAYSYVFVSESKYADGNWHMLTFVRDVENLKGVLYFDGEKVGQYTMTEGRINDVSRELYLGAAKDIEYYTGKIDDLRIYNSALSAETVKSLYDALNE